jgi:MoaA/NifB/PqqE/SkfB family radical SAM enzyme
MTALPSGWQGLKQRALQRAQPLSAYLELTYRCTWRCVFCYNPRHSDRRPLALAEWLVVLDDLRALGTLSLTLTGGEPLAHPDFLSLARAARERRFALRIFTNGTLVDEPMADALRALDPVAIELSVHGASAATHESCTGAQGSFASVLGAIARLKQRALPLVVKTLLNRRNEHELDALIAFGESLGVAHQIDATVTPRDDGNRSPLAEQASAAAVARLMQRLAQRAPVPTAARVAGGVNCGLGRLTLAIDPEGDVFPCLQWRHSALGNVRTRSLRDLWAGSAVRAEAADVAVAANDALLARGGALAAFPYCPALAWQHTGNALQPDANHRQRAEWAAALRVAPNVQLNP